MAHFNFKPDEIDAIIFDCDGTLVDSEPITVQVLVDHVSEFGLKLDYEEALALFVGRDMTMIVEVLEKQMKKSLPCLLYTSPSPRDGLLSRMPSSA